MADSARDAFRHNAWATAVLIDFCRQLSPDELSAPSVQGTFGDIYSTLRHFVTAEGNYRQALTGEFPKHWRWRPGERPSLDELAGRNRDSATFWEALLARDVDADEVIRHRGPGGGEYETRLGVIVAQALNHANHHRDEIAVLLSILGREPPELSGFRYGEMTGRRGAREA